MTIPCALIPPVFATVIAWAVTCRLAYRQGRADERKGQAQRSIAMKVAAFNEGCAYERKMIEFQSVRNN